MAVSVDDLKSRHADAWNRACDLYAPRLYGFLMHLVRGDARMAEELHQQTWLAAVDGIGGFDPRRGEFSAWLFAIARHVVVNHYRRVARQACEKRMDDERADLFQTRDGMLPHNILEQLERVDVVRATLLELNDDQREVLSQKYLEGLSVREIAKRTNRSAKAVESLLTRSREKLRGLIGWYVSEPDQRDKI
jgi:RNA polymerase sigma-70 factor (ECF subfamily)